MAFIGLLVFFRCACRLCANDSFVTLVGRGGAVLDRADGQNEVVNLTD